MKQQIELDLGGRKRKFTFGILFLGNVLDRQEFDGFDDLIEKLAVNYIKYTPILMYESLVNTCNKFNDTIDFTEIDIINWLDDKPMYGINELNDFVKVFTGSTENKTPLEAVEEPVTTAKKTVSKKK